MTKRTYCGARQVAGHGETDICGQMGPAGIHQCASCRLNDDQAQRNSLDHLPPGFYTVALNKVDLRGTAILAEPLLHCISWAYPTSPAAVKHGHGEHGCYLVELGGKHLTATATMVDALAALAGRGSLPDRYSLDHAIQLTRNAQKRALSPLETELVDLVCLALPYVEEARDDGMHKPAMLGALVKRMRSAINQADPK